MQTLTLTEDFAGGNWALARIIRRTAPWNLERPRFPIQTFFECARTGAGVDIYHLDTGTEATHAELGGRAVNVWSYFGDGGADAHGHGTSSASSSIGETVGVARGARLLSFKVYDNSGAASNASVAAGMQAALDHYATNPNPAIIMANFGVMTNLDTITAACTDAGLLVVASAHNFKKKMPEEEPLWPACSPDSLTVGGISFCGRPYMLNQLTDTNGAPQVGSNYGTAIDVLAPAQHVRVAQMGGGLRTYSGNSFSTPLAAGMVACLLQGHPKLTTRTQALALKQKFLDNATEGQFQPSFGMTPMVDRIAYIDPTLLTESF